MTDKNGNRVESNGATLSIATALEITKQPEDASNAIGENVTFSVEASGEGLSYQWEWRNATSDWKATTVAGNKTDTITVQVTAARNGLQYRCVVTDKNGNRVESNGATLSVATDFIFSVSAENTVTLTKYIGKNTEVIVPDTYLDKPVTVIGESSFEGNTAITSVTLPNSITTIGKAAFKGCSNLKQMTCY